MMGNRNSSNKKPDFVKNGESSKNRIIKLLMLVSGMVFLVCTALLLLDLVILPAIADKQQQEFKNIYYSDTSSETGEIQPNNGFAGLEKVNSNIAGWIRIPNTVIDFPVMQANKKNPDFYLSHDCKDQFSRFGSIFSDPNNLIKNPQQRDIILYGHTLNSGRMFTDLKKYKLIGFCKQNPLFTFNTIQESAQWKIFSVLLTNTLPEQGAPFNYVRTEFANDDDYLNFIYQLRVRSIYNTNVNFNARDKIILLSTCSSEFAGFRLVIAARKVRRGETASIEPQKIKYNEKVLYPDCWYQKFGGKKPVWPQSYQQAAKENMLP